MDIVFMLDETKYAFDNFTTGPAWTGGMTYGCHFFRILGNNRIKISGSTRCHDSSSARYRAVKSAACILKYNGYRYPDLVPIVKEYEENIEKRSKNK